jgi:sugar/nucleoside kinase (ribokinase family)
VEKEKQWAKEHNVPISFIAGLDFKKQTDNWFSLACACDYVVSVSTALVHFMGAAGRRVELLLTDKQAPFIWGVSEGPSLPYPNVSIHRRKQGEDNEAYLNRVKERLLP